MGLVPAQDERQLLETPPVPVELPFTEGVAAVFESGRLTDQSFSTNYQTGDALRQSFAAMNDHGLGAPDLPWPITDSVAASAKAYLDSRASDLKAARDVLEGPPDLRLQTGEEIDQGVAKRVGEARALAARAGIGAQLIGGLGVGVADPLVLATLPAGVAAAEGLFARMGIEAAIGGATQVGVEAASSGAKQRAGLEPTLGDAARNVAMTALGSAGLAGIFHGAGVAARRLGLLEDYHAKLARGEITETPASRDAANALQDAADTIRPGASPGAEAAHLDAVGAAVDVLTAEGPHAEMFAQARLEERATAWLHATVVHEAELSGRVAEVDAALSQVGGTPPVIRRLEGGAGVEIAVGDRTFTINDPSLAREKWTLPKIRDVLQSRLDEATAARESAVSSVESAWSTIQRLVGDDIGRPDGTPFRTPKQAEAARDSFGANSLEVVRLGKQRFVLRSNEPIGPPRVPRETIAAAVDEGLTLPVEAAPEHPIDSATPPPDAVQPADLATFTAAAEANPDLAAAYTGDGGALVAGRATDLVANLEGDRTTLRSILECVLAGGPVE